MTVKATGFGWIETDRGRFQSDILVYPDGTVENRYDYSVPDSHSIGRDEVRRVLGDTNAVLVIGTGQYGMATLEAGAEDWLRQRLITFKLLPTPAAVIFFNQLSGPKAAIFHLTC
ncbi:MAG: MTH938/NDUFAF3 family protein [bacterium]|jgi:hypothetical protein